MKSSQGYFKRVHSLSGTRYWVNNPTRAQAAEAIECGAVSCTTNPTYVSKMLEDPSEAVYVKELMADIAKSEPDDTKVVEKLQSKLVENLAQIFQPVYKESGGQNGYVSIQGDPFNEKANVIVEYGKANAALLPNITPKIPVTTDGLEGISALLALDIPIIATEIMCIGQFLDIAEAYKRAVKGKSAPPVLYFAHIAGIFDEHLQNYVKANEVDILPDILWQAGITVAKKICQMRAERGDRIIYLGGGARGLHHFTEFVGMEGGVTINWTGTSEDLLASDPMVVQRFLQPTPHSVIEELCEKLPDFAKAYDTKGLTTDQYEAFGPVKLFRDAFEKGWKKALDAVAQCR